MRTIPPRFRPDTDIRSLFAQLESFCEARNRAQLHRGIRFLVTNFKNSPKVLNRCLDWYWRCGMLKEGLALAAPSFKEVSKRGKSDSIHALGTERALFYLVFLANQSGLPWVRRWLAREEQWLTRTTKDHLLIANLWIACQDFERAEKNLRSYQKALNEDRAALEIEQSRMVHLTLAYIQFQTRRYQLAEKSYDRALKLIDAKAQPLVWADAMTLKILSRALGAKSDDKRALRTLLGDHEKAVSRIPELLARAPRLFTVFETRKMILLALAGEREAAKKLLREVDQHLTHSLPDYSPFRRIELLFGAAPHLLLETQDWELLAAYPDSPLERSDIQRPACESRRISKPSPTQVATRLEKNHVRISPLAHEYQMGPTEWHFGIPKEIELLSLIRRAHPIGIHRNLAMALLWPEQGALIEALSPRLSQLVQRLREQHGFKIRVERECLFLEGSDSARIHIDATSTHPLALVVHPPSPLNTVWISSTYQVGPTQARVILQKWIENGWVTTAGRGAHTRYTWVAS
jgi:tetratricopeptide (TPR) repeat protein